MTRVMENGVPFMRMIDLGRVSYPEAQKRQKALLEEVISGDSRSTVLFLEHPPVLTIGRDMRARNYLDEAFFARENIPLERTERGGGAAFHCPGQLVLYPVIDLGSFCRKDIVYYIDTLEMIATETLLKFGIRAERDVERRGVWVSGRKIAFIGVAFRKWVSYHGIAVNINNDTEAFRHMNVCGEEDITVTSCMELLGRELDIDQAKSSLWEVFREVFQRRYPVMKGEKLGPEIK